MADNIPITPGTGATVAADTIATVSYQRVKIDNGADGVVGGDVCSTNPLPISVSQGTPGTTNRVTSGIQCNTQSGSFSRPATTPTYVAGQLVANSGTAGSVTAVSLALAKGNDVPGVIIGLRVKNSSTVTSLGIFRVHVIGPAYAGVSLPDASTFTMTNTANLLGYFDVTMTDVGADGSMGYGIPMNGAPFVSFQPLTGTSNVDFLIEARAAYVGVSGQTFTIYADVP